MRAAGYQEHTFHGMMDDGSFLHYDMHAGEVLQVLAIITLSRIGLFRLLSLSLTAMVAII